MTAPRLAKTAETRAAAKQRWMRLGRTARVLGVLEGHVVYRFKGAGVSVMHWRDFEANFTLSESGQPGAKS